MTSLDKPEAWLLRASRRSAFVSLAGVVIVFATFLGGVATLGRLQAQVSNLEQTRSDLEQTIGTKRAMIKDLDSERDRLQAETKQLEAARDKARQELEKKDDTLDWVRLQLAANKPDAARQVLRNQPSADTHEGTRLFIEIRSKDQEPLYQRCAEILRPEVEVPHWQLVETGPASAQMRYFHPEDKGEAEKIASKVEGVIGYQPRTMLVGGYDLVPRRHLELWFSPKETSKRAEDDMRGAMRRSR